MRLKEGEKVRLCTFDQAEGELHRDPPDITGDMEDYFDQEVTVMKVMDDGDEFKIKEDNGEWTYHVDWIVSEFQNVMPSKLKKMM